MRERASNHRIDDWHQAAPKVSRAYGRRDASVNPQRASALLAFRDLLRALQRREPRDDTCKRSERKHGMAESPS